MLVWRGRTEKGKWHGENCRSPKKAFSRLRDLALKVKRDSRNLEKALFAGLLVNHDAAYPDGSLLNYPRLRLLHKYRRRAHRPHEPGLKLEILSDDVFKHG